MTNKIFFSNSVKTTQMIKNAVDIVIFKIDKMKNILHTYINYK